MPHGRFFFLHVMKTGGSTFRRHIAANFEKRHIYPNAVDDGRGAYWKIPQIAALGPARHARTRIYSGHFPFFVSGLVPQDGLVTMTVLRDPVERTISLLSREQALKQPERSLEEIYDDRLYFARFVDNHMTKLFSMTPDDGAHTYFRAMRIDPERLPVASANLERVDVVGVQERFDDFLTHLQQVHGWRAAEIPSRNVNREKPAVSDGFHERIEHDLALDRKLYEHACTLAARPLPVAPTT